MSAYRYDVKCVKSNNNPADDLSRISTPYQIKDTNSVVNYLNFIQEDSPWPINWIKIKSSSRTDPIIAKIINYVSQNSWPPHAKTEKNIIPYLNRKNELSVEQTFEY